MKFGSVPNPENIDFSIPADHPGTDIVLSKTGKPPGMEVYVGCAKWNKTDLKNFYPKGVKDELAYYATQFNSIELNATFYRIFPPSQFDMWYEKTPPGFKFFPKVNQTISHLRRLQNFEAPTQEYIEGVIRLKEKLGTVFLQLHDNFKPKDFDRVVRFINFWPKEVPLAAEFRHTDWFNDEKVANELYHLLEENNVANVLVDTAGRRDLMHMRLTNNEAFVRYVGANHLTDYDRLTQWVAHIEGWEQKGLKKLHFFVHQNMEAASPLLSAHLIKLLNQRIGTSLIIPKTLAEGQLLF